MLKNLPESVMPHELEVLKQGGRTYSGSSRPRASTGITETSPKLRLRKRNSVAALEVAKAEYSVALASCKPKDQGHTRI